MTVLHCQTLSETPLTNKSITRNNYDWQKNKRTYFDNIISERVWIKIPFDFNENNLKIDNDPTFDKYELDLPQIEGLFFTYDSCIRFGVKSKENSTDFKLTDSSTCTVEKEFLALIMDNRLVFIDPYTDECFFLISENYKHQYLLLSDNNVELLDFVKACFTVNLS